MRVKHKRHSEKDVIIQEMQGVLADMLPDNYSIGLYLMACNSLFMDMMEQGVIKDYHLDDINDTVYTTIIGNDGKVIKLKLHI